MTKFSPIEIQKYLKGMSYPASLDDLIKKAEENKAPEEILNAIKNMEGGEFKTPAEVMRKLGETQ